MRFVLFLLISINYFCSAIDGNVNQHRFLRPEEIEGQVLPKTQSKLGAQRPKLPDQMQDGQKNVRVVRKPPSGMVPLISLMPSLIQFPGSQQTTQIESSFSVEASLPLFANEHDLSAETVATQRSTSVSTSAPTSAALRTTTKDYELDEQSEQEIDNSLGSGGLTMRLAGDSITLESQPRYKLIYFDARDWYTIESIWSLGICEAIRLIFRFANESFVDERLTKKQWLRMKDHTLFGKIPILEVDGKKLGQCYAISRYLARKFGLIGTDEWDQAKIDEVAEFHRGVVNDVSAYVYVLGGFKEGNKDQLRKEVFLPAVEKHFPVYVKLLDEHRSGFFGKSVSWIDFAISEFFTTIHEFEPFILKKYPALVRFVEKVHMLPQIRRYIRSRPKTPLVFA